MRREVRPSGFRFAGGETGRVRCTRRPNEHQEQTSAEERKNGTLTWSTAIRRWWTQESKVTWSSWSRSSSSKDVDDKSISELSKDWKEVFAKPFNELCEQCSKNCEVSFWKKTAIALLAAKTVAKQISDEKGKGEVGKHSAHLNIIQAIRNAVPFAGNVEK